MNAATKTKISNLLTAVTAIVVAVQTSIVSPPFTPQSATVIAGILTFVTVLATYIKQTLSADVSTAGKNTTLLIVGLPAVILALGQTLSLFDFGENAYHWISWSISVLAMIINITSKILFPSIFQQEKNEELKTIPTYKTQDSKEILTPEQRSAKIDAEAAEVLKTPKDPNY